MPDHKHNEKCVDHTGKLTCSDVGALYNARGAKARGRRLFYDIDSPAWAIATDAVCGAERCGKVIRAKPGKIFEAIANHHALKHDIVCSECGRDSTGLEEIANCIDCDKAICTACRAENSIEEQRCPACEKTKEIW